MEEYFEFHIRTRVIYQPGLANDVGDEAARFGAVRAFVVADPGVVAAGIVEQIRASLQRRVAVVGVASDVPANSSVAAVEQITSRARTCAANLLVGVGGGSALDTAKAVRMRQSARLSGVQSARTAAAAADRHPHDRRHRQRSHRLGGDPR